MGVTNLDRLSATYAQRIAALSTNDDGEKKLENLVTKALGVLQENGIYAAMLFLYSRSNDDKEWAEISFDGTYPGFSRHQLIPSLRRSNDSTLPSFALGFLRIGSTPQDPVPCHTSIQ